tara:strand:+ start:5673 stop:5786 length:114 start_codon:yes stop_codon:yes gene_type:complete
MCKATHEALHTCIRHLCVAHITYKEARTDEEDDDKMI